MPPFLEREKKRIAGTEEGRPVPGKSEKEVCRNGGRSPRSWKGKKRGLQEQRKVPPFLERVKKRFAVTGEDRPVPGKSEKEICGNGGSCPRSWKE
ncbi:hypothetical protein QA612_07980 [Evansella sp. AB-P1]|uniref:hypothetical protein n=1 Tax=Evansella sp. AB-P1 TaxID=3037653 RepID=UPI00241F54CF|nr:hypothetical protein [Evansella sp. AB-P1]MDG5787431.1 hypothetical protein [Evansella sp. AB-P1]